MRVPAAASVSGAHQLQLFGIVCSHALHQVDLLESSLRRVLAEAARNISQKVR
jgi:hypothetical protein